MKWTEYVASMLPKKGSQVFNHIWKVLTVWTEDACLQNNSQLTSVPTSVYTQVDSPEQPSTHYACTLGETPSCKPWEEKTQCGFLHHFIPFWQYPAYSCLPAMVWSSSWCSSDWPCCAISCPPTFCGRYWPAVRLYHRCSGWWSTERNIKRKIKQGNATWIVWENKDKLVISNKFHKTNSPSLSRLKCY